MRLRAKIYFLLVTIFFVLGGLEFAIAFQNFEKIKLDKQSLFQWAARWIESEQHRNISQARQVYFLIQNKISSGLNDEVCRKGIVSELGLENEFGQFAVANPDGKVICNSIPWLKIDNIASQGYFKEATRLFDSGYIEAADNMNPNLYAAVMARALRDKNGKVLKVILVAMDFSWVKDEVEIANLPASGHLLIVDAKGTLIAGSRNIAKWVDKNLADMPFYKQTVAGSGRVVEGAGFSGEDSMISIHQFATDSGNFSVIIDAPKEALMALAYRNLEITSLITLSVFILLIFFTRYWTNRFFLRRLNNIESVTQRLADNDLTARINSNESDELGQLAHSFDAMAEVLEKSINTRNQLEESVRENDHLRHPREQQEIVQTSLDGFLVANVENGQILEVNDIYCRLTGFSRDEILSKNIHDLGAQESVAETKARLKSNQEIGYYRFETRHHHKQGKMIDFEVSVTYSEFNKDKIFVFLRDITERKQIEIVLERSRARLVTFIRQAPVSIAMFDRDMNYLAVSGHWIAKFGLGYVDLIGLNHYAIFPVTMTQWETAHQQALSGATFEKKEDLCIVDGSKLWLRWTALPWFDSDEIIGGTIFFVEDITNTKKLETEIKERRMEMEQLQQMHVAAQTASAFAHEMNQPLLAIASFSRAALRMMKIENPDYAEIAEAIEGCEQQALRAGQSIRDIINFLNSKKLPTEVFDLNQEIINVISTIKFENNLVFNTILDLETGLPQIRANRIHVQKVLLNLLNNGIEAMQAVSVPLPSLELLIVTVNRGGFAQMTIQDNGPGIKKENINRLFEPFFTTKSDGIGMGLAISRSLIEENGGQLWFDHQEGRGATFHLTLPVAI
jgi:PAS domain S-box-containing protein